MKILYVAMKNDYGQPDAGYSFEHYNFFRSLEAEGHELIYFDFMTLVQELGRDAMNQRLLEIARTEAPELMFTVLFKDELDPKVVRTISTELPTITLNWFCDDHWRFESFSARWAPCFNWVVTTASSALPKYREIGYANVIKSQWACNHHLYEKRDLPLLYDVSFVGQPHGNRRAVIDALRAAGIPVYTRGRGWDTGRVTQDEMIRIFNQSRINLNLPNASSSSLIAEATPGGSTRRLTGRAIRAFPGGEWALRQIRDVPTVVESVDPDGETLPEQIKGRNFEVPGCGGFLLTGPADDLDAYYVPGQEIALFRSTSDLSDQIGYYLSNEDERQAVANAGYERTLREHTYHHRFQEIFARIGLPLSGGAR